MSTWSFTSGRVSKFQIELRTSPHLIIPYFSFLMKEINISKYSKVN